MSNLYWVTFSKKNIFIFLIVCYFPLPLLRQEQSSNKKVVFLPLFVEARQRNACVTARVADDGVPGADAQLIRVIITSNDAKRIFFFAFFLNSKLPSAIRHPPLTVGCFHVIFNEFDLFYLFHPIMILESTMAIQKTGIVTFER